MKKYDKLIFIIGSLLAIVPAYTITGWIRLCVDYPELSHGETVLLFYKEVLFNVFNTRLSASLFEIIFAFSAEALLIISLRTSIDRGDNFLKIIKLIVLGINSVFTFLTIWSIL